MTTPISQTSISHFQQIMNNFNSDIFSSKKNQLSPDENSVNLNEKYDDVRFSKSFRATSIDEYKLNITNMLIAKIHNSCDDKNLAQASIEATNFLSKQDFEKDFEEYMQARGCSNEKELKTFFENNNNFFYSLNQMKEATKTNISSTLLCMARRNPDGVQFLHKINDIVENSSIEEMGSFTKFISGDSTTRAKQVQNYIENSKILTQEERIKLSAYIDAFVEQLNNETATRGTVNLNKYVDNFLRKKAFNAAYNK